MGVRQPWGAWVLQEGGGRGAKSRQGDQGPAAEAPSLEALIAHALRLSANGDPRPRTVAVYKEGIAAFVEWCRLAGVRPLEATYADIVVYRDWLVGRGHKRSTIRLRLACVQCVYKALQTWGGRPDNPARGVSAPVIKESAVVSPSSKALSKDELGILVATMNDRVDRAIVLLMAARGLRVGEVAAMVWADIDGDMLTVRGKGGKARVLKLPAALRSALAALPRTGDSVFGIGVRQIQRIASACLAAVGLKRAGRGAHALRHTYGMQAALNDAPREAIMETMGHASGRTTEIYTRAAAMFQGDPADAILGALDVDKSNASGV